MKKIYFLLVLLIGLTKAYAQPCDAQFTTASAGPNALFFVSVSAPDSLLSHYWNFGDGTSSTLANPPHTFANCGTYTVYHATQTINPNGVVVCQDSAWQTITIACNTPCSAQAFFSSSNVNNQPNVIEFINGSTTGAGQVVCNWIFGDGSSITTQNLSNQTHVYNASGLYNVCLVVVSGVLGTTNVCRDTFCINVQVQVPNPTPCNLTANFVSSVAPSGNVVAFTNTSVNFSPGDSIIWNFGDGSMGYDVNPVHTYTASGTYTVCLRLVRNITGAPPCASEVCHTVVINNSVPCNLLPNYTIQTLPNQPNTVVFTNTTAPNSAGAVVTWDFGDSTTATGNIVSHTFTQPGVYTVCMHVQTSNTCFADSCGTVVINVPNPNPCNLVPTFNVNPAPDQTNVFAFVNTTITANAPQVNWSFGDSTFGTGNQITHVYAQPGVYTVCMQVMVSSSCVSDTCITITVNGTPPPPPCNLSAYFNWQISPNAPNTAYFVNSSFGFAPGDSITWNFGDGTISHDANPTHVFATSGVKNVCLRVAKVPFMPGLPPCVSEICRMVNIAPVLLTYPNPATNVVNVNIILDSATTVYGFVYNAQNVLVSQTIVSGVLGSNTITFNTDNLLPGYYTIRLYYNGQYNVARFLKL